MRRLIWPLIHRFKFNKAISSSTWGYISQTNISEMVTQSKKIDAALPKQCSQQLPQYFSEGLMLVYASIFQACYDRVDFLETDLVAPQLSIALNFLNSKNVERDTSWNIKHDKGIAEVVEVWTEEGIAFSNNHIFGTCTA